MKLKTRRGRLIAISVAILLTGVTTYAAVTLILAVGTIPQSQLFDGPATVTVRTLTIAPGESLQWHYHPGYAYNVVKSGTLTVEDGCGGEEETLTPGQAFEEMDGRVHRAKNLSATEPVVVYNTFIVPEGKPTTRNIPNNERRCGPPIDADECKDDGWLKFTHPSSFINQGQCIDYVRHRPRNVIPVPEDPLGQN
jgi:quercetin dioxygenase-like cupin family protein